MEKKKKDQEKLKQKRVDQKAKAEAKRVEAAAKALETAAAAAENPEDPEAPKEDITETSEEVPAATLSNGEEAKPAEEKIEEAEPVYEVFADDITEEEIEAEIPQIHQLSGFNYVSLCEISELVRGPQRPEFRKDCEVILLIGLPGAGKSHWAVEKTKAQPEKRYNVLGTKFLLEKMKLQGEARKPSNSGRWEKLIELCNRALLVLTDIACKRRRNYILDQPHVYTSAQRRKMRVFGDFVRIAMIIVPDEEEYKKRFDLRLKVEGKDIPESAVCEMKSNFSLPEMEYLWFSEIQYSDLDGEKAKAEVVKENEKGKKAAHRGRNDFNR